MEKEVNAAAEREGASERSQCECAVPEAPRECPVAACRSLLLVLPSLRSPPFSLPAHIQTTHWLLQSQSVSKPTSELQHTELPNTSNVFLIIYTAVGGVMLLARGDSASHTGV